ncbi:MAG: hypothetical protein VKM92_07085 [Cyanobacteriota bacterium]|nr:hypothetical protein [Cyanobacteriota bacterium]
MADAPYLIAMALLLQDGRRAMPLQGKSLKAAIEPGADPAEVGCSQVLELLLRIWQRSGEGPLQRAAAGSSLLLAEVPIEALQSALPQIKSNWINSGDTDALLAELRQLAGGIWSLTVVPRGPLHFERLQ